ncbi:hypothetical protein ACMD2_15648 [Ananas comosus]|uniref:Uncharacterized protein n=1 Tax=Ananas comosus TaxID=4615 RepID=A0A199UVP0_ANACO|nr:hypothetical protein ACMD2_15648 [Ananas comosus]
MDHARGGNEITALTGRTGRGLPDEPVERGGVKGIRGVFAISQGRGERGGG